MKITPENEESIFKDLKLFYVLKIRSSGDKYGYKCLSRKLMHDENYISTVIRRDAFSAIRRLYNEIKLAGYMQ